MKSATFFSSLSLLGSALAWVKLEPSLIPIIPQPLPVFTLSPPASFPLDVLNSLIEEVNPGVKLECNKTVGPGLFAYDGDRLVAYVDEDTGETQIFPNLATIEPATEVDSVDPERVWTLLYNNQTFPPDDTNVTVVTGSTLYGTTTFGPNATHTVNAVQFPSDDTVPAVYYTHGVVERSVVVGNVSYPVCGPGSQASFGVASGQEVVSLAYSWRAATRTNQTIRANATSVVVESIKAQLEPIGLESGEVKVDKVEVCFYDSGKSFMQPVYRFFGTTHANSQSNTTVRTRVEGYVPIGGGSPELIPVVNEVDNSPPPTKSDADHNKQRRSLLDYFTLSRRAPKPKITVGRYVVRNDIAQWTKSANNFWNNLNTRIVDFTNSQFFWSYPYIYTTRKERYINSVNVALTEAHGSYHLFSTESNCCDLLDIEDDIPDGRSSGYGPSASQSGQLAYWFIHSCEVIPTPADFAPEDRQKAYEPWWDVFNGMHAVLGYRTQMYIADNAAGVAAKALSLGAPVVSAWMKAVNEDVKYRGSPTYFSTNANKEQPFGRASAIFVCGHENDRVWQVEDLGKPKCLRTLWYNN